MAYREHIRADTVASKSKEKEVSIKEQINGNPKGTLYGTAHPEAWRKMTPLDRACILFDERLNSAFALNRNPVPTYWHQIDVQNRPAQLAVVEIALEIKTMDAQKGEKVLEKAMSQLFASLGRTVEGHISNRGYVEIERAYSLAEEVAARAGSKYVKIVKAAREEFAIVRREMEQKRIKEERRKNRLLLRAKA